MAAVELITQALPLLTGVVGGLLGSNFNGGKDTYNETEAHLQDKISGLSSQIKALENNGVENKRLSKELAMVKGELR